MFRIDRDQKKLRIMLEERSRKVLEKFKVSTISGTSFDRLIAMLGNVNSYWKDYQRPALAQLCCEAVGGQSDAADDVSVGVALAVAGMGIHDDIIDKSENKHFRETLLGRYGLDNALLVGDLLIIKGLFMSHEYLDKTCPANKKSLVFDALRNFIIEIYEGELMDITCRKKLDTEPSDYVKIIGKLASDGEACSRIGAILGGGSESEVEALAAFGRCLGIIVNLREEVSDVLNLEGNLPNRIKNESVPLPLLYAAKTSKEIFQQIQFIFNEPSIAEHTKELRTICWKTRSISYIYDLANKQAKEARAKLDTLPDSYAKKTLALTLRLSLNNIKRASSFEAKYIKFYE